MKINTLSMENFRCFEHAKFDLDERITLIVGDNAKGKTTILEGLSVAMGGFLLGVPHSYVGVTKQVFVRNLQAQDVQRYILTSNDVATTELKENCKVTASGSVGKYKKLNWHRLLEKAGGRTKNKGCEKVSAEAARIYASHTDKNEKSIPEDLPVLIHYGTGRLWAGQKTKTSNKITKPNTAFGYYYALKPDAQNRTLMPWLERIDRIAYTNRTPDMPMLAVVYDTITAMIPGAIKSYYSPDYSELVVEFKDKAFPYTDLSDGQRNMITLAGDLAMRCAQLNQHLGKNAARKTPGVVLVDEIDANIHPGWQKTLLPNLLKHFENIQFVVTSHSPFILQSLDQGKIINLDHAENPEQKAELWDRGIEDIVTEEMGVDTARSEQYQKMLKVAYKYYRLLDSGQSADTTKVKSLGKQLDEYELEFSRHPAYVAMLKAGRKKQGLDG